MSGYMMRIKKPAGVVGAYNIHSFLWRFFPEKKHGERTFLFRDENPEHVLVVSSTPPAPEKHDEKMLEHVVISAECPEYKNGARYKFALDCYPSVASDVDVNGPKKRGKPRLVKGRDEVEKWLVRKLGDAAELELIDVEDRGRIADDSGKAGFPRMSITGVLSCKNPKKLGELVGNGVGKGKAFGLGLLVLAPCC